MIGVKQLSHKQKEPFLPQPPSIDAFLALEDNLQPLFDTLPSAANHLAHCLQAIINQTLAADTQNKKLLSNPVAQNTVEEGVPGLSLHLSPRIVLENLDLCPNAQEERVLAKGKQAILALPRLKVEDEVRVVEERHIKVARSKDLVLHPRALSRAIAGTLGRVG